MKILEALTAATDPFFTHLVRGLEKESLRIDVTGVLSQHHHPISLGNSLTHAFLTTDFAESQLEMVTPPLQTLQGFFHFFDNLHRYLYQQLDQNHEMLWPGSMPSRVDDAQIRLAQFGNSHAGQFAHIYRQGLALRYGKKMQMISGIHYNFSPPLCLIEFLHQQSHSPHSLRDFQDQLYFRLVRNFKRTYPLLLYLFGATPVNSTGEISPWATSLRMSHFGYHNPIQRTIRVRYDGLPIYLDDLEKATKTPYPPYEKIGEFEHGQRIQLNTHLLQIENEFYAPIRPKQVVALGERQLTALKNRGVAYVEVRIVDIDPFLARGIDEHLLPFLDVFLTHCLLQDEACLSVQECAEFYDNLNHIALFGRRPNLTLSCQGKRIPFRDWLMPLYEDLQQVAQLMDTLSDDKTFRIAVDAQLVKINDPSKTPSARVLTLLENSTYHDAMLGLAKAHRATWLKTPPDPTIASLLDHEKIISIQKEQAAVASSMGHFEDYRRAYFC